MNFTKQSETSYLCFAIGQITQNTFLSNMAWDAHMVLIIENEVTFQIKELNLERRSVYHNNAC